MEFKGLQYNLLILESWHLEEGGPWGIWVVDARYCIATGI
jgi:hypothetical protein